MAIDAPMRVAQSPVRSNNKSGRSVLKITNHGA